MAQRIFIACTPRTGNVWIRRLLADSIGVSHHAAHTPEEIAWDSLPQDCVVAMHVHNTSDFRAHLARYSFRPIVTTRHPLDVLVSILQFSKHVPETALWLSGEGGDERSLADADALSQAFLDYCLSDRAAALLSVSPEWAPDADAVARYESFVESTQPSLQNLLKTLKLEPSRPLADVINDNAIDRLRTNVHEHHFWRGHPGLWRRLLPFDIATKIAQRHQTVFELLHYKVDADPSLSHEEARANWRSALA